MAETALGAAQWVVRKALAPVTDGALETWAATRAFGLNIQALKTELDNVQATLDIAATKELPGLATEKMLQKLRDSAHNAEDLLDELDYFRIHGELHATHDAADQHGDDLLRDLACDARHTIKALGKLVNCLPWQRAELQQRSWRDSFLASHANQEVSGCMPSLGKLLLSSCSPHPHVCGDEDRGIAQEAPMPEFNRADFSQRMKETVEQLKLRNEEANKILRHCGPRTVLDISQRHSPSTPQSAEQKLYGRDHVMNSIIHDITVGQYCDKGLTVLPVIGPGGMGKTTLIQHIYDNQQMRNHFPVRIWICVSFNFNLDKVLEQIMRDTLCVEGENGCSTTQELIEHKLKHKRFLLVLDDVWQFTDVDDWKKLLLILGKSQEKGSMILVTTRQKEIANLVKKTAEPKELNGLEPEEFRKLFLVYVFDVEQYPEDKLRLLHTGDKIMEKLKGSPLAAKTVGRLLSKDLSLPHWRRVLNSKQWAKQTNGIMAALELSYDFLPFRLQRCFSYSALFPEDYRFRSRELISLWIGLDFLIPTKEYPTFEKIGLSNIRQLVVHGFFREEETDGDLYYVMHDLLHDLALKVASHYCLSLRFTDVGSMEIQPSIRHLSINTDDLDEYDGGSVEKLKSELEELKTRFKVKDLQTLMLFGEIDEDFVKIFGDFLGEVNALRVLHLPSMLCPVESVLHNFSVLVHLRYLLLGTKESQMHLPLSISKFYHLRILDLELWDGRRDLPKDMSNLAKLCRFYVSSDELHSDIYNVGKLKLLEELKVFQVKKKSEGFEPKQLEHLTKLRELGIYDLEKIDTVEEAAQANLREKKYLRRLTLHWEEPGVEAAVLERLQPHEDLQVLCIRGHGGPPCPTWLGDELAVEALQSLYLYGVSWDVFPSLGMVQALRELSLGDIAGLKGFVMERSFSELIKLELIGLGSLEKWVYPAEQECSLDGEQLPTDAHIFPLLQVLIIVDCPKLLGFPFSNHTVSRDWFPKLQELEICDCPEFFLSVIPISLIESLRRVLILRVKLLKELEYSKSSDEVELIINGDGLHSIDQVLDFDEQTCFEKLRLIKCPPLELKHLQMLTSLKILFVHSSDGLVGPLGGEGDVEWQLPIVYIWIDECSGNIGEALTELSPHLPKLSTLKISSCKNIKKLVVRVDVQQTTLEAASEMGEDEITTTEEEQDDGVLLFPAHLSDSLRELDISGCPELVLVDLPTLVPGGGSLHAIRSLQRLTIMKSPKFLSAFSFSYHLFPSSLQFLELRDVKGMGTLEPLSNLSSLTELILFDCGRDLKCEGLQSLLTTGGQLNKLNVFGSPGFFVGWDPNPRREHVSSTLRVLCTDDVRGLVAAPICSFLSSSLTKLYLADWSKRMERFSKEQEDALQLLSSLQELSFMDFKDLQQLPSGLHNLSLEKLYVHNCSKELTQQCRGLEGTIVPLTQQKLYVRIY